MCFYQLKYATFHLHPFTKPPDGLSPWEYDLIVILCDIRHFLPLNGLPRSFSVAFTSPPASPQVLRTNSAKPGRKLWVLPFYTLY